MRNPKMIMGYEICSMRSYDERLKGLRIIIVNFLSLGSVYTIRTFKHKKC